MWRPVLLLLLLLLGEGEVLPRDMWQEARLLQGACFRKCKEASASASRQGREEEKRESGVCVCVCVLARLLALDARASKTSLEAEPYPSRSIRNWPVSFHAALLNSGPVGPRP